jgi:FkbM family methyltransferase
MQDEHGNLIDTKRNENDEQLIAKYCIEKGARVLELGARYGTVTYQIAQHAKHVVAVEPDEKVWDALENNLGTLLLNNVSLLKGFLSKKPQELLDQKNGYAKWSEENSNSKSKLFTLADAEEFVGGKFDTLVADCEGCLPTFLQENPDVLQTIHTVIYEADRVENADYGYVEHVLIENGFSCSLQGFQNVWTRRPLSYISLAAIQFTSQNLVKTLISLALLLFVIMVCVYYKYYN